MAIGLGAMIVAGIFALVGVAVEITGPVAYISFILAGILALLTAYNVAKLAIAIPNKGGKVSFLNHCYDNDVFAGGLSIVTIIGYIIVNSLYARAFSEYLIAVSGFESNALNEHLIISSVIIFFLIVNFFGARLVGKVGLITAIIQTVILLVFGLSGSMQAEPGYLTPNEDSTIANIILVSGIIFMSYEGFGLISNTASDIRKPRKNLSKAIYISILIVIAVYLLVTISVIGNLDAEQIVNSKEYVLAEAAKPIFGAHGFLIMGIAALFSTASAINATIYGPVYMLQEISESKQLPSIVKKPLWRNKSGWAILIYGIGILLTANLLNLETIAETGSLIFLFIYLMVNIANYKMSDFTKSKKWIIILGVIATLFGLTSMLYFLVLEKNHSFFVFLGLLVLSFGFEWMFQRLKV